MGIHKISHRAFSMRSKSLNVQNTKSFQSRKRQDGILFLTKKLRFFSVAEAHGLIYPRPSGENFSFTYTPCLMIGEASLQTSPKIIMIQDMINSKTV